jgi:general secretion pathway protein K
MENAKVRAEGLTFETIVRKSLGGGMTKEKKKTLDPHGMALIIVLWVLTLLSVLALEFCFTMRTELNLTRNYKEKGQLYYYAQGGIHRGIAELIYRNDPALHQKRTAPRIEAPKDMEKEWQVDGTPYAVPFQNGEAVVKMRSETGRISLNRAPDQLLRRIIKYFVEVGEQRDVIVDSILDWRDSDDFRRVNGAENDYYRSLPEPYDCKNADFDTVEELLLVRGITPELFHGKKAKGEEGQESPVIGLKDIFSVFSTSATLDINSASIEALMVFFGMPYETAKKVVEAREERPFINLLNLVTKVPEIGPFIQDMQPYMAFSSATPYYTITSLAKLKNGESKRGVECVVRIDRQAENGYRVVMWKDVFF